MWALLPLWQVWFRVNEQLPSNLQKSLPDRPPELPASVNLEGESLFEKETSQFQEFLIFRRYNVNVWIRD